MTGHNGLDPQARRTWLAERTTVVAHFTLKSSLAAGRTSPTVSETTDQPGWSGDRRGGAALALPLVRSAMMTVTLSGPPIQCHHNPKIHATVAAARQARQLRGTTLLLLGADGAGLMNLQYAPLAGITGRGLALAPAVFNCAAPDSGNMGLRHEFGTAQRKQQWLRPLLEGRIRSASAMTEAAVASSDASNFETSIVGDGDAYVITGRKWYITGPMNAAILR